MRKYVLGGATLVTIAALVQLLTFRETVQERNEEAFGPANVLTLSDSVMHQVEGNTLNLRVWSERTTYAEERQRARLENVRFTAYPKPGQDIPQEPIHGVAKAADVLGDRSILTLEGDVHIYQGERVEIRGQRLRYRYRDGLIDSSEPVWMRNGKTIQQGTSGSYSIPDQILELTRPLVWE